MLNETGKPLVYPFGFAPTLHRYRLNTMDKLKMGNNIFVGAMADVFGAWIPDEWIWEILNTCMRYPLHNFLFLTKNPERYEHIDAMGRLPAAKNMWYGSTLTNPEDACFISNKYHTFWSIEPIHAPFKMWEMGDFSPDWVIIGAETGHRKEKIIPEKEWVEEIVDWCDKSMIPIFMKKSMVPIIGEGNMRRNFPEQLQHTELSLKMKKKLFGICAGCKSYLKKSEMITMLARSKREEQPKQFAFMCKDCFEGFCKNMDVDIPELAEMTKNAMTDLGDSND